MNRCTEHEAIIRRLERVTVAVERAREDIVEVRNDLKGLTRALCRNVAALVAANGARREQIGELRGRVMTWAAVLALIVSAAVSLAVRWALCG